MPPYKPDPEETLAEMLKDKDIQAQLGDILERQAEQFRLNTADIARTEAAFREREAIRWGKQPLPLPLPRPFRVNDQPSSSRVSMEALNTLIQRVRDRRQAEFLEHLREGRSARDFEAEYQNEPPTPSEPMELLRGHEPREMTPGQHFVHGTIRTATGVRGPGGIPGPSYAARLPSSYPYEPASSLQPAAAPATSPPTVEEVTIAPVRKLLRKPE